jgi:hypothetical protein
LSLLAAVGTRIGARRALRYVQSEPGQVGRGVLIVVSSTSVMVWQFAASGEARS